MKGSVMKIRLFYLKDNKENYYLFKILITVEKKKILEDERDSIISAFTSIYGPF